jgi:hypothetical protein
MAAGDIKDAFAASAAFTITLASLANATAQQSSMIDNSSNLYSSANIFVKITSGSSAPTAGSVYSVYLLRRDDHASPNISEDSAGGSDAAITIENATPLGVIIVTASANKAFIGVFSTTALGPLGKSWGIAIKNNSGQTIHATEGNHLARWVGVYNTVAQS